MERSLKALSRQWLLLFAGLAIAFAAWPALADPPTRAARISLVSGSASFSPAGSDEWVEARVNRPIWIGDRLWAGDGRIELQLGGASLRMAPGTSLQVLNFDDRIAQFEVTQGAIALHVRVIDGNDSIEINTPTFAFVTREEGDYRIDVERDYTAVAVRRGFADVYGQDASYRIDRREQFAFYSADLRDFDAGPLPRPDAFDRWVRERAQREDRSLSARYVSPELVGYVDLDQHGDWRTDTTFGAVWIPRVAADWAPYRHGNWTWVDPWGWTWIDDAPWGYAPSHYGRWTRIGVNWAWVPGPRTVTPVYAPALVAWVGGDNFSLSFSTGRTRAVGWFPLAPGEIWRPSYDVSREYFTRVNVTNTVVNNTTVVNVYNNRNDVRITNVDYRFRSAPAAITAVPVETFVQSRPVQRAAVQVNANAVAQANVLRAAPATPVVQSIVGQSPRAQARPPADSMKREVVARTAPAAVPTIENRAAMVREGKPMDRETLQRAAPQAAQPAAPQPAGRAPASSAESRQVRGNVRVVDAEKAQPAPVPAAPGGEARATRRAEREDAKAARETERDDSKAAARPAERDEAKGPSRPGQAPQAAQPGREIATPPKAEPRAPERPQPSAQPAPPAKPQPAPPVAQPPREAAPPVRGDEAQPRGQQGRPVTRDERDDRPGRGEPPAARGQSPAAQAPPAPRAAPAPRPDIAPPNVEQLRGRDQPPGRRELNERAGPPSDERRVQPVMPKNGQPAQPATPPDERRAQPVTPVPRAPETAAPRAPSSPPPAAQAPRPQPDETRRAAPPQPQRPQADAPRPAAPPAAQPPAPSREQPAETRRDAERGQPKGKGKDRDEEEEKEKDRKGRN